MWMGSWDVRLGAYYEENYRHMFDFGGTDGRCLRG